MADFYKRLIFGEGDSAQEFKLAVNLSGNGAPDETTAADVGMLYLDTSSEDGDLYKCMAVTVTESGTTYAWKKLGDSAIYVLKEGETVDDAPADAVIVIDPYDDTGEDEDTRYDAILATVPNKASVEGSTLKMQRETTDDGETTVTDLFEVDLPSGGETTIELLESTTAAENVDVIGFEELDLGIGNYFLILNAESSGMGLSLIINGNTATGYTGSTGGYAYIPITVLPDIIFARSTLSNGGQNYYYFDMNNIPITSINVTSPYHNAEDKYYPAGTTLKLYRGVLGGRA